MRLALALVVLAVAGPFVQALNAQSGSRYALTAALVEDGTIRIDDYRAITLPMDRVELDDALYSDKAPGQPFFAVPAYALARAAGAEPATVARYEGNLGVWWVMVWSSAVPMAALVVLMYDAARRWYPDTAPWAALGLWVGTLWLVLSSNLYGHALATALAFGAWRILADRPSTPVRAGVAGALVGLSVLTEYQMALVAIILAGYVVLRRPRWNVAWYVAGGIPPALALLAYQAVAFGDPFQDPYALKAARPDLPGDDPSVGLPDPAQLVEIFVGTRGLIFTAIVVVGIVGAVWVLRTGRPGRTDSAMALVVVGAFLALQAGWPNPWGGEVPGPRYLMAAVPWLVVPVAAVWSERRTICAGVVAVGAASMSLALIAPHTIPHGWSLLRWYPKVLQEEGATPTVWTMALGPLGAVVQVGLVVAAAAFLVRSVRALAVAEGR